MPGAQLAFYGIPPGKAKLVEQFERFHRENPHIYELFKRFAGMLVDRGYKHHSSDAILHRIRWHVNVETVDATGFKINDHYTAFYSRLFERDFPQHAGFFRKRASAADGGGA